MRFLADENIQQSVVNWLKEQGHNVVSAAEVKRQLPDKKILNLALKQKRVLLTNDTDFGEWIFAFHRPHAGVILFRFQNQRKEVYISSLKQLLHEYEESKISGGFVVLTERQVRFRKI